MKVLRPREKRMANWSSFSRCGGIRISTVVAFSSLAISLQARAEGPQRTNTCGACTITYSFKGKKLTRSVDCSKHCWSVPGFDNTTCGAAGSATQGGIATVTADFDTAEVTPCVTHPDSSFLQICGETGTDCEITYLVPDTLQDVAPGSSAESAALNDLSDPVLVCNTSWNGEELLYTVTNNTDSDRAVTWVGTPFVSELVTGGGQAQHVVPSATQPDAVSAVITFEDPGTGTVIAFEATTYVRAGTGIPTASGWGLIVLAVLLLTAIKIVFGRQRRPAAA